MGHPGSDPVGLLVSNSMHASLGHRCRTTGPTGQRKSYREEVKSSGKPYRVKLWITSNYVHCLKYLSPHGFSALK